MSIVLYDKALIDKFRNWTGDTNLNVYGPQDTARLFQTIADSNQDQSIKLPIVVLKRNGGYTILRTNKNPVSYDGMKIQATTERTKQLNAIPISIPYQIDIYTRYFEEADAYARNFVFNMINYPRIEVEVPYYEEGVTHYSNIKLQGEVEDASDVPERLIAGQFYRMSIKFNVDDAHLFDIRHKDVYKISTDSEVGMTDN